MGSLILEGRYKCPRLKRLVTMNVKYMEIPVKEAGRHFKRGLIVDCNCNASYDCSFKDEHGRCPVYLSFPNPKII